MIDVSDDGYNNAGPTPAEAYRRLDFAGITVNALVIGGVRRPELLHSFEVSVIRGPGDFALATE